MLIRSVMVIVTVFTLGILATPGFAMEGVDPDYPGVDANGGVYNLAVEEIQLSVAAFQEVFGRMPDSWLEVRQSGVFDRPVIGFQMQEIDPDDGRIDFPGDVYLDTNTLSESGGVLLFYHNSPKEGTDIVRMKLDFVDSFAEQFDQIKDSVELSDADLQLLESWYGNEPQLIQFGQLHVLFNDLMMYKNIHGRYPMAITDLIEAGLGPCTVNTINPVTGSRYLFDGSEGDVSYTTFDNGQGFQLVHVDTGVKRKFGFTY
ncbi:MAG: hypothetical protein R3F46_03795 [bacterium]